MSIYFAIIIIPLLLYFFPVKQKRFMLYAILTILFLISTFRMRSMGADYSGYVDYFYRIAETGTAYFKEKGYIWLNIFASKFGEQYYLLAFAVNLMLFVPLAIYTRKVMRESEYWILVIIVFLLNPYMYLQTTFNGLRQCCAIGVLLLSVNYLKEKKYVPFIIIVMVAAQFHILSLVMLLLPIFFSIKWNKNKWKIVVISSFILSITVAGPLITAVANFLSNHLRMKNYSGYDSSLLNNILYLLFIFIYTLLIVNQYDSLTDEGNSKWYIDLYLLSLIMLFFGVKNDMVYRARIMFSFLALGSLPRLFDRIDQLAMTGENSFWVKYGGIFKDLHIAYYVCFWIGYILYLWIKKDPCYIPFQFCF